MKIRKSRMEDLPKMEEIYQKAREFMIATGNPHQWSNGYPAHNLLVEDIQKGISFVCEDDGEVVAVFCFYKEHEIDYDGIFDGKWLDDKPYGVIHRIASIRKGAGSFCIDYCYKKTGNIRIDTGDDNIPMQKCLLKNGFKYCGRIVLASINEERMAFHRN
ncbi:MAG: GNAT family N-acetyltransferase [Clostridia bacterium]|nr:GNAT family N-acetyltransferase [Clostridia bacterium]